MTIGEFIGKIKRIKLWLKDFTNEDIYNDEKSRGKKTCVSTIRCVLDEIESFSKWIEKYKNDLTDDVEIGKRIKK